ncbi:hypothetical protein FHT44_002847 [Mycolicibacterium sp. BK634]|uniref:NACHT domain-containing protein n=1 Tax=Mycolicibacterium sp. BK634 TaxID=2587099 RepID=UPI0016109D1E|nr:hypothetical protein [Mycolicibacterium sp. BK634]MBB3750386.1 hypothetical protein [Mycolicibacterium sp. BK634]
MATNPPPRPLGAIGPYLYENLGEDKFQELCQVIVANKFDRVTCYPVGQKDGGRDIARKATSGGVVYQVKWSKNPVKNPLSWMESAVASESDNIRARVRAGARHYVLMTSISGTAAVATGPNGRGAGTIDKLDEKFLEYAKDFGLDSMECWWRDDIDALVTAQPRSLLWRFQEMLCGPEAMRFLLDADAIEVANTKLARLVRKVVGTQWEQDSKVKFKQAELDKDDLEDLFVDVRAAVTTPPNAAAGLDRTWSSDDIGAADYLVSSRLPFALVRGEPGQGKSTLGQYVSQVFRSAFVPDVPGTRTNRPAIKATSQRIPLRIDLRDYGTWLEGTDPFNDSTLPRSRARPRRNGGVEHFLVAFLAAASAQDDVDVEVVNDLIDRFPLLLVLDGLDEVAQRSTRQRIVEEIENFVGRWRTGSAVPRIIVTTRPNVSGLPEPSTRRFELLVLHKLSPELRRTYLRKWCDARSISGRDRRELIKSFDLRTAEPHIAQLAENPMQLTILLYLLHLQGHSVPDKRTQLYDDYMKTFLNREAEKSVSVRENRHILEEVTAYLGWHLQGLAEREGGSGRLSVTALKTEIFRYLTLAQKDTTLVGALFTDVTDRVWALTSKVQNTFEFDVQPVREFFAAKYLAEYAMADKSDVLKELIRRPYWFNTSRFYAGFAVANELGGLVDGLAEEFDQARHPFQERVATWTLLADGVFSLKTTAQRRAADLLCDDLTVSLLPNAAGSGESLPALPRDRGAMDIRNRLVEAAFDQPSEPYSEERLSFAAGLDGDNKPIAEEWLKKARSRFGGVDEEIWLRLSIGVCGGQYLQPADINALALPEARDIATAISAGVAPEESSRLEQAMVRTILSGLCSDIASTRTGLVFDLVNALSPREFINLAKPNEDFIFPLTSEHCDHVMPTLKRQDAFRRLRKTSSNFHGIQRAMNTVRRSPTTVAPWSDSAEEIRRLYGPCWLAADIAIIGASINPSLRRDMGPMNPACSPFGAEIDYGRLVNDIRTHSRDLNWWKMQRESLNTSDRAVWVFAMIAVASAEIVKASLADIAEDFAALDEDAAYAVIASSSRLGLSRVSRRLSVDLLSEACTASPETGLLVAHHLEISDRKTGKALATNLAPEGAAAVARYGAAGWPGLYAAGVGLAETQSTDWLASLRAHGPTTTILPVAFDLSDELIDTLLSEPAHYPIQWVQLAESCRSRQSIEQPLLTSTGTWFED